MTKDHVLATLRAREDELRAQGVAHAALFGPMARGPGIAWRSMRDAGNLYRHDDDRVLEEFVWSTVTKSLPPALAVVETELARIDRHPEG